MFLRAPSRLLALVLTSGFILGASCDGGAGTEIVPEPTTPSAMTPTKAPTTPPADQIRELPQVTEPELTSSETRRWVSLINEQTSPCGDAASVARCATGTTCRACVPAARYLRRLVADGYEQSEIEEYYAARYGSDSAVEIDLGDSPVRGAPMASVTIVEFSDFECPYCGRAHPVLSALVRQFEGRVRVIFKNYPLDAHEHAAAAARAAEAARRQGKFWEMHDALFENQRNLTDEDIEGYAREIGLDMDRFGQDIAAEEVAARVAADRALGRRLDIAGTPTIYINGRKFGEPLERLEAYIQEELDQ